MGTVVNVLSKFSNESKAGLIALFLASMICKKNGKPSWSFVLVAVGLFPPPLLLVHLDRMVKMSEIGVEWYWDSMLMILTYTVMIL